MRPAALAGLVVVLFASHANAQLTPYRAVVSDPEVKVRATPGDLADTGTLPRGTVVVVEKEEENGWLAITAPYGSVSWIATQFIEDPAPDKATPKNVFVHAEDKVTLAVGKSGDPQPLNIRRVQIPNGTGLMLLGPKVTFAGKTWYPIAPPAGDLRYIPKTAVQFEKPATNNFVVRVNENTSPVPPAVSPSGGTGPVATIPGPGSTPAPAGGVVASKPAVNHPLWIQAETAERENRFADAEKAYFDLAALMNAPGGDHDIANVCYTRIHTLRERKRNGGATPMSAGQLPKEDRGVRPGAPQAMPSAGGTGTNTNTNVKTDPPAATDRQEWVGTLRVSALTLDGIDRKTYSLETAPGVVKVYVLAGPGVDLAKFVGKRVSVVGAPQTRQGLSKPYIVATTAEAAQ